MKNKSPSQSVLICLFVVVAFVAYNSPARAAADTTTWTGAVSGDWFDEGNWDNGVPTSSTDAFINNGGKAQINSTGATARSLTLGASIGDSGTVVVDGAAGGSLDLPPADNGEELPVQGAIYVGYAGRGTLSITNGGTVTGGYGYIAAVANPPDQRASNGTVTVDGAHSTWTLNGLGNYRLYIDGLGTTDGGTGLLNISNAGTVIVINPTSSAYGVRVGISGTLAANGTIRLNGSTVASRIIVVSGTLAPSNNLKVDGELRLASDAATLSNVTPGDQSTVDVSGSAVLGGRLSVTMTGDFSSAPTRFTLLHADGSRYGIFFSESINYPTGEGWTPRITYGANDVYLDRVYDLDPNP